MACNDPKILQFEHCKENLRTTGYKGQFAMMPSSSWATIRDRLTATDSVASGPKILERRPTLTSIYDYTVPTGADEAAITDILFPLDADLKCTLVFNHYSTALKPATIAGLDSFGIPSEKASFNLILGSGEESRELFAKLQSSPDAYVAVFIKLDGSAIDVYGGASGLKFVLGGETTFEANNTETTGITEVEMMSDNGNKGKESILLDKTQAQVESGAISNLFDRIKEQTSVPVGSIIG